MHTLYSLYAMHAFVFPYKPGIIIYLDANLIPGFYPVIRAQLRLFELVIVTLPVYYHVLHLYRNNFILCYES